MPSAAMPRKTGRRKDRGAVRIKRRGRAYSAVWALYGDKLTVSSAEFGIASDDIGGARSVPAILAAAMLRELVNAGGNRSDSESA
jgi:hypothetical protein